MLLHRRHIPIFSVQISAFAQCVCKLWVIYEALHLFSQGGWISMRKE